NQICLDSPSEVLRQCETEAAQPSGDEINAALPQGNFRIADRVERRRLKFLDPSVISTIGNNVVGGIRGEFADQLFYQELLLDGRFGKHDIDVSAGDVRILPRNDLARTQQSRFFG